MVIRALQMVRATAPGEGVTGGCWKHYLGFQGREQAQLVKVQAYGRGRERSRSESAGRAATR